MKKILLLPLVLIFLLGACSSQEINQATQKINEVKQIVTSDKTDANAVENSQDNKVPAESSSIQEVTIERVIDGDSAVISSFGGHQHQRLRVLSLDCPEDTTKKQWLGNVATKRAKQLIEGKQVKIELSAKSNPYDKYRRLLAYVWIDNDTMLEDILLEEGLAQIRYLYAPDLKYKARFMEEQNYAKSKKIGVWKVTKYATQADGFNMEALK